MNVLQLGHFQSLKTKLRCKVLFPSYFKQDSVTMKNSLFLVRGF